MEEFLSQDALKEIDALLEIEPEREPAAPGPDIPSLRERLAVLVSSGRSKEAIGVHLSHDQVKRLPDKDVEKLAKRYETWVGSKTTDCFIDGFIFLATHLVQMGGLKIKDVKAYQKELKEDYILNNELSFLAGKLSLYFGRTIAAANAALITAKHVDFSSNAPEQTAIAPEQTAIAPEQTAIAPEKTAIAPE